MVASLCELYEQSICNIHAYKIKYSDIKKFPFLNIHRRTNAHLYMNNLRLRVAYKCRKEFTRKALRCLKCCSANKMANVIFTYENKPD